MDLAGKRVLLTGGAGFVGAFVGPMLEERGAALTIPRSRDHDLTDQAAVAELLTAARPDVVVHLAAEVGGIGANRANPGRYFYANMAMGLHLVEASRRHGVAKFVQVGTVCAYPKHTPVPFREADLWEGYRQVFFNAAVFLLFLYLARFLVLGQAVIPFIYPVAAYGLLLTSLFGMLPGLILPISLSFLITFGMANQGELTLYYAFSTIFAVLLLGSSQRIISFFWAGIGASAAGAALVAAFRLLEPQTDLTGLATLMAAALIYGLASAGLAILLQFVAAKWLRKTTNLQLVELSRPEHPLLRLILLKAPGTYQHSLQVANLAEQAAERVEADPLLTRVGAMYHDAGKTTHPQYFIENQIPGTPNLHDSLSAQESAEIIIRHVTDGVELARKHRLPKPIIDFILEHHGTTVTRYQYVRAVNEAGGDKSNVDIEAYTYPGPRPQSKETALVMLADGCEARARAERPPTEFALRKMIKETIDARIADNQLDDVPFTPRDLNVIQDVFTSTLKGVYHPRLEYPKIDQRTVPVKSRASGSDSLITEPTRPEILGETGNDD